MAQSRIPKRASFVPLLHSTRCRSFTFFTLAALLSSFLHVITNVQPPSITISHHLPGFNAEVVYPSPSPTCTRIQGSEAISCGAARSFCINRREISVWKLMVRTLDTLHPDSFVPPSWTLPDNTTRTDISHPSSTLVLVIFMTLRVP